VECIERNIIKEAAGSDDTQTVCVLYRKHMSSSCGDNAAHSSH